MSDVRLIQTKLSPPRVNAALVERPRLTGKMTGHRGRLILVSAPAGFGKTVLVADWLGKREGSWGWLSLDRLDNDPSRFCAHLAAAVEDLGVESASRAASLVASLPHPDPTLPPALREAFAELGSDPVLVLDDLHEVDTPEVLSIIEGLALLPAPAPRLILLTRVDPPFSVGRLRVEGELLELRARDLRFTEAEALRFFDGLLPDVLTPELVRRLGARAEGWAAGLRLAAIALQDVEDPGAMVESFAGTHRFVMDYLLEEALNRQPPALQRFLLDTSVLRRFTSDTCVAVTGDPEAEARLMEAERANLFLVPLGREGEWYRYHHLFSDLLRFRLGREPGEREGELHRRASLWFEEEGDVILALEHASQMEDRTRLLEILDAHAFDMLSRSQLGTLRHWMAFLPEPFPQGYPMLAAILGWVQVVTERAPNLPGILKTIRTSLDKAPPDYDPVRLKRAGTELEVITAYAARHQGALEESVRLSEKALQDLSEDDPFTRGLLRFNLARVRMMLGEMAPAAALLEGAFDDSLRAGNFYLVLSGLGQQGTAVAQTEGVRRGLEFLAAGAAFAEERGIAGLPAYSTVLHSRGRVALLGGDMEGAEQDFRAAVELGGRDRFPEGHGNGLIGLARIRTAQRRFDEAEACLVETEALGRSTNLVLIDTTLPLEKLRLALAREAAGKGPPTPPLEPERSPGPWTTIRETEHLLALSQSLLQKRFEGAGALADTLLRESERGGRGPARCAALLALALLPDSPDRWEALDRALAFAATLGYVSPILDGGEAARDALRAALPRPLSSIARAHARLILDIFDAREGGGRASPEAGSPDPSTLLPEPLTDREEEVLAFLFQGRSNKTIARSIFVSVDTVKTHLRHIYEKLGVSSRTAAVARARELGYDPGPSAEF